MRRYLFLIVILAGCTAYAADRAVLQNGSGQEVGTVANPLRAIVAGGVGTGNVATGETSSLDNQIVLFDSTTGLYIKKGTFTGVLKGSAGVVSVATAETDYTTPAGVGTLSNKTIVGGSNTITGITESMMSTSDVTTLDVSISKHGFVPKAPNDATKYLDGTGAFSVPAGGGGGGGGDVTAVGDCASGACFNGTAGTVLTLYNAGGNATMTYDGTDILFSKPVRTTATSVPQTDYFPALASDTHWIIGVNGDGGNDNDDNLVISEGSTLGSSNRVTIAPGGLVTIPSATITTITGHTTIESVTPTGATGTGKFVFDTGPQLSTIELGAASDTTLSRSSAGVLAVEGVVIPSISSTNTLTNKRWTKRDTTTTQSATPTINTDNTDHAHITALAQAVTSFTTNLSGTPVAGDTLWIDITDNGTARAITWGASFEASGTISLPTTTVVSTRLDVGFIWNEATSKWRIVGVS